MVTVANHVADDDHFILLVLTLRLRISESTTQEDVKRNVACISCLVIEHFTLAKQRLTFDSIEKMTTTFFKVYFPHIAKDEEDDSCFSTRPVLYLLLRRVKRWRSSFICLAFVRCVGPRRMIMTQQQIQYL